MIRTVLSITSLIMLCLFVQAQTTIAKQAPPGFDSLRTGIAPGKIDTITYTSKTVGANRRALIYTPPGYSKKRKISRSVPFAWYRWR